MTPEEALHVLGAGPTHERLKAARLLARNAQAGDLAALRRARQIETVSYVKTTLDRAINRLCNLPLTIAPDPADEFDVPEQLKRQIKSQAVEWIAGLLLHEIASSIGLVKRSASREVLDYNNSRTKRHLDNIERVFEAIEQLKGAAAVPRPERFDLAELLGDIVNAEAAASGRASEISLVGQKPMMITSDPALVRLVVSNGVRNALEAVELTDHRESHPIVMTWGETDVDYWVSVLDRGVGIVGPTESAFEIGKSTKQGHSGFGLAIARQGIETLGGTVALESGADGGARYVARWER